jgi:hypothetical protein
MANPVQLKAQKTTPTARGYRDWRVRNVAVYLDELVSPKFMVPGPFRMSEVVKTCAALVSTYSVTYLVTKGHTYRQGATLHNSSKSVGVGPSDSL